VDMSCRLANYFTLMRSTPTWWLDWTTTTMLWLKLSPTILLLTLCPSVTSRKTWSTRSSTLKPGRLTFARKSTQKFHGNIWWRHAEPVLSLMPPQQFSSGQCKPNFSRRNSGRQPFSFIWLSQPWCYTRWRFKTYLLDMWETRSCGFLLF
jgi:hypothetical protein